MRRARRTVSGAPPLPLLPPGPLGEEPEEALLRAEAATEETAERSQEE